MKQIKAPEKLIWVDEDGPVVFLAGSIEMGTAEKWQDFLVEALRKYHCVVLNPRRDNWDNSWEQKIDNLQFREQVMWELKAMEHADIIAT